MEKISREDARSKGLKFYFTGKPCARGHVTKRYVCGWSCFDCVCERAERWHQHPERVERRNLNARAKKYGVTAEYLAQLQSKQNNCCATCHKPFVGRPHTDHDHQTGRVRGLLCKTCNWALGHAKDDPEVLRRMADYLDQSRSHST